MTYSRACGMAILGARVHPFMNALNGQKIAHKMMRRRPKNIFPEISGATRSEERRVGKECRL